ncbi:MAG: O-methyltransferase [Bacteroidia bacterium]
MSALFRLRAWWNYRKAALSKHGVHSPFVFDLITNIFPDKQKTAFENHPAEIQRRQFLTSTESIAVTDFGTGVSGPRKISDIAKHAAKQQAQAQLLHRIVSHAKPQYMLELGTSLGITTAYLASATNFTQFISLEGCAETATRARGHVEGMRVDVRVGEFNQTLSSALDDLPKLDFVFFDGNHRYQPTLAYFNACLQNIHNDTLFIFDDIHWSAEMEQAWNEIAAHPQVRVSIDLFDFGLVFFRQEQPKQHFVLKF